MKKLLPVLFFVILASQIQAQYKPIIMGLRAGMNLGWVKPNVEDYKSEGIKPGFTWGFISEFYLMENYAISTGFNVNFNGGKMEYPWQEEIITGSDTSNVVGQMHRTYKLKYIQIPLCLKMKTKINDKITAFGKLGIGTAFSIGARANDEFIYEGGTETADKKDINDEISLMRESLIVGGGIEMKFKESESTALIIDITYDNAFNNLLTGDNPLTDTPKAKHNFVELGVGIVF
jgi:hypothetical protein